MRNREVVITGMGCISPYGLGCSSLQQGIENDLEPFTEVEVQTNTNKTVVYPVGLVPNRNKLTNDLPRELTRTMSLLSVYSCLATREAFSNANINLEHANTKRIGTSISSSITSMDVCEDIFKKYYNINPKEMSASIPFKALNHASAFNTAKAFNLLGRCISSSSACAGGLQSIALGYEAIKYNKADIMVCGGVEEYHPFQTLIFNKLGIASKKGCKPFDLSRDGIIVSEGAGVLILEEEKHALKRGANILGKVLSAGMNISQDISYSSTDSIIECMREAYTTTEHYSKIAYVNAHATGTSAGDIAEGKAIQKLLPNVLVNSLKGYFGHTMGACGSIETIATILGLLQNKFYGTKNFKHYDHDCNLSYANINQTIRHNSVPSPTVLKNSFGLGGVNCTLIFNVYT